MSTDRLLAICALAIAGLALALAAWVAVDASGDDRDACAMLADLGAGVGVDTARRLTGDAEIRDAGVTLLTDCLTA